MIIKAITNFFKQNKMQQMKKCTISGISFEANSTNFYVNRNANDGLHPYHKDFDNFRRQTGATVSQVRKLVETVNR